MEDGDHGLASMTSTLELPLERLKRSGRVSATAVEAL